MKAELEAGRDFAKLMTQMVLQKTRTLKRHEGAAPNSGIDP
jgi:hypothetical protein